MKPIYRSMEDLLSFACENASIAHWIFVVMILLAGLNVPFSEDIILISAGAIASSCAFGQTTIIFISLFLACWISAWEAYWIGRLLGPKLYDIKWFSYILTRKRIDKLHHYYEKFGFLTFIVGRFIPGGVRNALFMTSGLGKMPFGKFIIRDFPGCLLSVTTLFYLGYFFGLNYHLVIEKIKAYNSAALFVIASAIIIFFLVRKMRNFKDHRNEETLS